LNYGARFTEKGEDQHLLMTRVQSRRLLKKSWEGGKLSNQSKKRGGLRKAGELKKEVKVIISSYNLKKGGRKDRGQERKGQRVIGEAKSKGIPRF